MRRQILKAVHKIADHSLIGQKTKKIDVFLVIAAICTAVNSALRINMYAHVLNSIYLHSPYLYSFISLGFYGVFYSIITSRLWTLAAILWITQYVGFALFVVFRGFPSPVSLAYSYYAVTHQPLCTWPSCRQPLLWRGIYCDTVRSS
jgi:hypothetical protein